MVPAPEQHTAPASILVVEDEVLIRLSLAQALRDAGFLVIEAADADEALSYLRAGAPLDLIFTDVQMPGSLSGADLARRMQQDRPDLPVILTSAHLRPALAGTELFIPKPYEVADAVALVRSLLRPTWPPHGAA